MRERTYLFREPSPTQWAVILLLVLTLLRLWLCQQIEIVGDEAQYWLWSKHLDWSYFSKGPGVAWAIYLGTGLFGDTELGIRILSVFLSAGTGWFIFLLARDLFGETVAFWALAVAALVPLFVIGSVLMTIDPPSVFFWALAAWFFWNNRNSTNPISWLPAGLAVGIGMLFKYTNAAQLVCFFLFLLVVPSQRKQILSFKFLFLLLAAAVCLAPILNWNAHNDWITFKHLEHRGALDEKFVLKPHELTDFLLIQSLVFHPFFTIGLIAGAVWNGKVLLKETAYRYLLCLFVPLVLFYTILSLQRSAEANWTAPSFVAGAILVAALWSRLSETRNWAWALGCMAIGITVVIYAIVHLSLVMPISGMKPGEKLDVFKRARGSRDIARQLVEIQKRYGATFLLSNKYAYASLLSFYHPDRPTVYLPTHEGIQNQFSLWPDYSDGFWRETALLLSDTKDYSPQLDREFEKVELVSDTWSYEGGNKIDKFYIYLLHEYGGKDAEP